MGFSRQLRIFSRVDWLTLGLALLCSGYGLVLLYAATARLQTSAFLYMQALAIGLGVFGYFVLSFADFSLWLRHWWVLLLGNLVLQGSLLFFGVASGTNRSWLRFGGIGIQPAEIGKLLFLLTFCAHLSQVQRKINRPLVLLGLCAHAGLLVGTVLFTSQDLGMASVYALLTVILLFVGGLRWTWFALFGAIGALASPLVWNALADYQRLRFLVLQDPTLDADIYYQTLQSITAIGAGQVHGKGLLGGTQTQYGLLPASHTDFIFAVAGEAFGMVGCLGILFLLLCLILRLFHRAFRAKDAFSRLFAVGVAGMFLVQSLENIFMCLGLFPVMGLTLPLFSYGGSSVVTMYCALAKTDVFAD